MMRIVTTVEFFAMQVDKNNLQLFNVTCNGGSDGQTYVTAAGGTYPTVIYGVMDKLQTPLTT